MSSLVEKSVQTQPNGRYLFNPCTVESLENHLTAKHHSLTDVKMLYRPKNNVAVKRLAQAKLHCFGNSGEIDVDVLLVAYYFIMRPLHTCA
jgi:hypothetical protein